MKRLLCIAVACAACSLLGAKFYITEYQAIVSGALGVLKLEPLPPPTNRIGAPPKFKITKQTLTELESLMKQGKLIEIQGSGELKIVDGNAK